VHEMVSSAKHEESRRSPSDAGTSSGQYSEPITLAIWGDPVVARALTLLLGSSGFETKILSGSSSDNLQDLKGIELLILTPTPNLESEDRKAFLASVSDVLESTKILILELATLSKETREGKTQGDLWYTVPWPCKIQMLQQWIETALAERERGGIEAGRAPSP
jgi:hypothetical protein